MSFKNYIPTFWNTTIDRALKEYLVAADFCNQSYTGDVAKAGDQVRILQAIRPTINETDDGKLLDFSNPEEVDDTSLTMTILHQPSFNYYVNDVDKAQAQGDLKSVLSEETTQGIANKVDTHIFEVAATGAGLKKTAAQAITVDTVLNYVNSLFTELWKNNVPSNTPLELDITPTFHQIFLEAYEKLDTNNTDMLKNGIVGRYNLATVRMSNNIYNDGTYDHIVLRTNKAIAYAKPLTLSEAIRAANRMSDVIRGQILYEAKVTRPKELIIGKVKY